ncbi:hypothetical protein [Tepidibacillus fermentans]|nr:hypothetical protein [Tepidibacillus fermentans]
MIDRTLLILYIFALRAKSKEGKFHSKKNQRVKKTVKRSNSLPNQFEE